VILTFTLTPVAVKTAFTRPNTLVKHGTSDITNRAIKRHFVTPTAIIALYDPKKANIGIFSHRDSALGVL